MAETALDTDLVTLANVKAFLNFADTSDTSQDTLLSMLIAEASSQVSNFCERKFATTTYTAEKYDCTGSPRLYLRNWPICHPNLRSIEHDTKPNLTPAAARASRKNTGYGH